MFTDSGFANRTEGVDSQDRESKVCQSGIRFFFFFFFLVVYQPFRVLFESLLMICLVTEGFADLLS